MKKDELEKHLMNQLSGSGMDNARLKSYSSQIARALGDIELERIYLKGQPWPDAVVAQTRLSVSNIAGLKDLLSSDVMKLVVHPIGVPVLKEINVEAHFSLNSRVNGIE